MDEPVPVVDLAAVVAAQQDQIDDLTAAVERLQQAVDDLLRLRGDAGPGGQRGAGPATSGGWR